jgi:predicted DNA-binding transcriptional regulator AlpA
MEMDVATENDTTPSVVLTPPQVASLLGMHKHTLWRMRNAPEAGGLPFVKLSPQRIGYIRDDVLAYLAARRVGKLPEAASAGP